MAGRQILFEKWAETDAAAAAAAANYVLENPERCPPALIGTISHAIGTSDSASALKWVNQFPGGPYFDQAASNAALWMGMPHPDEARQLIARMSDPEMRKDSLRNVEKQQALGNGEGH